ncbi:MAG: hypothetical protein L6V93_15895 [Clostridiales bacterium]|nr:MAG: hypothetical protein L6V93_15895 [Clostridiales bacterium]
MTDAEIRNGLLNYKSDGIRQSIIDINGAKILNDCYNSSPQAAKSAIDVLKTLSNGRKIAVLGDMAELGEMSEKNITAKSARILQKEKNATFW